jgi:hypothetical protein
MKVKTQRQSKVYYTATGQRKDKVQAGGVFFFKKKNNNTIGQNIFFLVKFQNVNNFAMQLKKIIKSHVIGNNMKIFDNTLKSPCTLLLKFK